MLLYLTRNPCRGCMLPAHRRYIILCIIPTPMYIILVYELLLYKLLTEHKYTMEKVLKHQSFKAQCVDDMNYLQDTYNFKWNQLLEFTFFFVNFFLGHKMGFFLDYQRSFSRWKISWACDDYFNILFLRRISCMTFNLWHYYFHHN